MTRSIKSLVIALSLSLAAAAGAWAYQPMIHKILIDGTTSISESDFQKENQAVAVFIELLYQRSQAHPGQAAEWVSVSWFGSPNDYSSTIFINCSDINRIRLLEAMLLSMKHPGYNSTAIYTAILYGTVETIKQDESLSYNYFKDIILITDGDNNSSASEHVATVNAAFPNNSIFLFVVGVGSGVNVNQFSRVATSTLHISDFSALAAALSAISDAL
jgi:hypothetical protein